MVTNYYSVMHNYLFFNIALSIFCLFYGSLNTQAKTYQHKEVLLWDAKPQKIVINAQTEYQLYGFEGAHFSNEQPYLAKFLKSYPIDQFGLIEVRIQNPVFETVLNNLILAEDQKRLSTTIKVNHQLEKARNQYYVDVSLIPFQKTKTGVLEKLVSFDLVIELNPIQKREALKIYADNSKLSSGDWFKIEVGEEGIYKLTADVLKDFGAEVANIALDEIKVHTYNEGMLPEANADFNFDDLVETPVEIADANNNNRFDGNDAIFFYAPGIHTWAFDVTDNHYKHSQHLYSKKNFVMINTTGAKSIRIANQNETSTPTYTTQEYDLLRVHENENHNLVHSGREWYGELFEFINEHSISFSLPNVITTEPALITSRFAARSIGASSSFQVKVNNSNFQNHFIDAVRARNYTLEADVSELSDFYNLQGDKLDIDIQYNATATAAKGWLDYIEVNAKAKLIHNNSQLIFFDKNTIGESTVSQFEIGGSGDLRVWEVTDLNSINALTLNNRKFNVATPTLKKFAAFNTNTALLPLSGEKIENQNIHGEKNIDYLIVSHPDYLTEAERLADFHQQENNLKVLVTTPEKIYNEFSNGIPDVTAIRNFVRMFYHRASNTNIKPKYLLMFGDASYDYLNLEIDEANNTNFVPTFESHESRHPISTFCTDDYFVLMDANEGGNIEKIGKPDLAVGRIPCFNVTQAQDVVDKIIHYKSILSKGSWLNNYTIIADDEDGNLHFKDSESHTKKLNALSENINIDKIYQDAYEQLSTTGGGRYPEVNDALNRKIETGTFVLNYVGHGGENGFAHERILQVRDIKSWENKDKLPLFITATCSFSPYDNPNWRDSAGERVILRAEGGAIAIVSTTRVVYASQNKILNGAFIDHLFTKENNEYLPIGTIMQFAKMSTPVTTNVRKFALLGDPAIVLNYPKHEVVTTQINDIPIAEFKDTLKSLSKVKISGEIIGYDQAKMEGFNGTVFPNIFDKSVTLQTLANDEGSSAAEFDLQNKIIFKGQSKVTNGSFNFEFIIPKDIKLFYGNGKISYYALDENTGKDAAGAYKGIIIGGIAEEAATDNQKPDIELYMNNTDFVFGGTTNESPDLLALLFDDSGINTVGNGIGHNITGILDGDESNPIILNDYYRAAENDFSKGTIRYPLKNLEEGKHTLKLRAFDVHNNWNEAWLEFYVFNSDEVQINNVINYPNPFTTSTEFYFEHNQVGDNLQAQINIYTLTGKLVKTIQQVLPSEAFRVKGIMWDGLDHNQNKLGRGTYIYKVTLHNGEETFSSKYQKLMLLR